MGKITQTWSLMSESWQVLRREKGLLIFPFISGVCCLALLASFAVPIYATDSWHRPTGAASTAHQAVYYGVLFLFYVCNYFIVVFFNSALIACATMRMTGGNPTVGDGFRAAASRLPVIAGWAVVSATVGLILRLIEDRSDRVGQIVAGLFGAAWTLVSFLVVPILVVENKNPIAALKDSAALMKRTWGEQLVGNFSFEVLFIVLGIPAFALIAFGVWVGGAALIGVCVAAAVVYLIVLALVHSALHAIFQAALYLYARNGQVPPGFDSGTLAGAIS